MFLLQGKMNLAITNIYVGYVEKQITAKPGIWA